MKKVEKVERLGRLGEVGEGWERLRCLGDSTFLEKVGKRLGKVGKRLGKVGRKVAATQPFNLSTFRRFRVT